MSKVISCPVKRFTGDVVLPDHVTMPQLLAWNKAIASTRENEQATMLDFDAALLPVILSIVERWKLANFPENPSFETWPASPAGSAARLRAWLIEQVTVLITDEGDIPNE